MPSVRSILVIYLGCGPVLAEKALGASLEGRSDTSSESESDLTSTYNSESAFDYMPAADLHSGELSALPIPTAPLKAPMEQVVQKQIPIKLRRRKM